jgi:ElaB/YqjD/DUF883 family membrane-anchored ribosome-binding protein
MHPPIALREGTPNAATVATLQELLMSLDHDPLTPMGVQSADTVQVEAAERAKKAKERIGTPTPEGAAKADHALEDVGEWFRERSKVATDMAVTFARERPVEATLIACAAGALLIGLVMLASKRD